MEPMKLQRPTKPTLGRQFEFQFPASMLLPNLKRTDCGNKQPIRMFPHRLLRRPRELPRINREPKQRTSIEQNQRASSGQSCSSAGSRGSYKICPPSSAWVCKGSAGISAEAARNSAIGRPFRQIRTVSPRVSTSTKRADNFVFASWVFTVIIRSELILVHLAVNPPRNAALPVSFEASAKLEARPRRPFVQPPRSRAFRSPFRSQDLERWVIGHPPIGH